MRDVAITVRLWSGQEDCFVVNESTLIPVVFFGLRIAGCRLDAFIRASDLVTSMRIKMACIDVTVVAVSISPDEPS